MFSQIEFKGTIIKKRGLLFHVETYIIYSSPGGDGADEDDVVYTIPFLYSNTIDKKCKYIQLFNKSK
jgi:hypothetical protein